MFACKKVFLSFFIRIFTYFAYFKGNTNKEIFPNDEFSLFLPFFSGFVQEWGNRRNIEIFRIFAFDLLLENALFHAFLYRKNLYISSKHFFRICFLNCIWLTNLRLKIFYYLHHYLYGKQDLSDMFIIEKCVQT